MPKVEHVGDDVTVTTDEGHRIGFKVAQLNAPSNSGEVTTEWAGGVTPRNTEVTVRAAKEVAERHVAEHAPEAPAQARAVEDAPKSVGETLKGMVGL